MNSIIKSEFNTSIDVLKQLLNTAQDKLPIMAEMVFDAFKRRNKLIIFGNGGSAADAQHIAAELVGHFQINRKALPCLALTTDTSILTAVANDFDFSDIFARQLEGLAVSGDIVLGISTSGNSENIIHGFQKAAAMGCTVLAFGGKDGGKMIQHSDYSIVVPSFNSQRVQEGHALLGHVLCSLIEHNILQHSDESFFQHHENKES